LDLFPLLEERARERGGFTKPSVTSTPHPNPPLKWEGVRRFTNSWFGTGGRGRNLLIHEVNLHL
jgi:hypothetical protein